MISCANLSPEDIVLKKMLYLYITHYATSVPDLALLAINQVRAGSRRVALMAIKLVRAGNHGSTAGCEADGLLLRDGKGALMCPLIAICPCPLPSLIPLRPDHPS